MSSLIEQGDHDENEDNSGVDEDDDDGGADDDDDGALPGTVRTDPPREQK